MLDIRKTTLKRWAILLISPILWTTCFVLIYLIDEAACGLQVFPAADLLAPTMLILIGLTLIVNMANVYWGWRMWHGSRLDGSGEEEVERDRFIGFSGMLLGALFAFLTVGLFASVLVLNPC